MLCASILLLGRSFYVLYVRGIRTRTTTAVTWASLVFMVGFWTWYLWSGGWQSGPDRPPPDEESAVVAPVRIRFAVSWSVLLLAGCTPRSLPSPEPTPVPKAEAPVAK